MHEYSGVFLFRSTLNISWKLTGLDICFVYVTRTTAQRKAAACRFVFVIHTTRLKRTGNGAHAALHVLLHYLLLHYLSERSRDKY